MKTTIFYFLIIVLAFVVNTGTAQDIIFLRNGDEIKAKVLEVSSDIVKYKKTENINGPTYSTLKSEIFMIKYENGTKEMFEMEKSNNTILTNQSSEDIKKEEAIKRVEKYVRSKVADQIISIERFLKTNGEIIYPDGQLVYRIEFVVDVKFNSNGWLIGNGLEGYWNNGLLSAYASKPDLSADGLQYMYDLKFMPAGNIVSLTCIAELKNTDNGFLMNSLSIRKVTYKGIITNYDNNNSSPINKGPKITPKYEGEQKEGMRHGKGKQIFEDGSIYEGEWKNDKREGYGEYTWQKEWNFTYNYNYKGHWKNDLQDSTGVLYLNGYVYEIGFFRNDDLFTGIAQWYNRPTLNYDINIKKNGVTSKNRLRGIKEKNKVTVSNWESYFTRLDR